MSALQAGEEMSNFPLGRGIVVVQFLMPKGREGEMHPSVCPCSIQRISKRRTWYGVAVTDFLPCLDLPGAVGCLVNLSVNARAAPGREEPSEAANLLRKIINMVDMISKNMEQREQASAKAEIFPSALLGRSPATPTHFSLL